MGDALIFSYILVTFLGLVLGMVVGNIYKSKFLYVLLLIAAVVLGVYIKQTQPTGTFLDTFYLTTYLASALICNVLSDRKRKVKEYEIPIFDS